MSSQSLFSLSRVVLLLGCALIGIGAIVVIAFSSSGQASTEEALGQWLAFAGALFLNLGLPALFARYAGRTGVTGLVGYTLIQVFFLLEIVDFFSGAVVIPFLTINAPSLMKGHPPAGFLVIFFVGPILGMIGNIVYGIALLRSGAQFRVPGIILLACAATLIASGVLPNPGIGSNFFGVGLLLYVLSFAWLSLSANAGVGTNAPVAQTAVAR